jgi:hypothetical protein
MKRFILKPLGETNHRQWEPEEFDKFLKTISHADLMHTQFTPDLSEVVVIYVSEIVRVNRREHDGMLVEEELPELAARVEIERDRMHTETIRKQVSMINDTHNEVEIITTNDIPAETPLGEQIDSGTEEADADQPTLF